MVVPLPHICLFLFFFNDTATTEIYTLSLHDALPICSRSVRGAPPGAGPTGSGAGSRSPRSEEHTSELQSHSHLVCRLLPEKKKIFTRHTRSGTKIYNRGTMAQSVPTTLS